VFSAYDMALLNTIVRQVWALQGSWFEVVFYVSSCASWNKPLSQCLLVADMQLLTVWVLLCMD
jgi:hypothetical protein